MPKIKSHVITHDADEEGIMRRLAKAVAVQWDFLSELEQTAILAQAGMIHDLDETVQLKEQLKAFVEKHKTKGHI